MRNFVTPDILFRARRLRLVVFDVDGVLSDGILHYADNGSETKGFHSLDGQGIKQLRSIGLSAAILTARQSKVVERRAKELGIEHVIQASKNKLEGLRELSSHLNLQFAECAHVGDDLGDVSALRASGLAFSVPGAPLSVRECAHYITRNLGGRGAVREICDLLVRARAPKG